MIEMRRRLGGVLPYAAYYFPDDATVDAVVDNLGPSRVARLFFTRRSVTEGRFIIGRYLAATLNSDLTQDLDQLWRAMDDTCRRQIRRAEKLGSVTAIEFNQAHNRADFLALLRALADKNANVATVSEHHLAQLEINADVFVLYLDGKPNCAHLFLRDSQVGRARLLHSANRRLDEPENRRTSADLNRMLHWYEMKFYKGQGFEIFDLGGINREGDDGIARFKASFGGEMVSEYVYLCAGLPRLANAGRLFFELLTRRGRQWRARAENVMSTDTKESNVEAKF